MCHGKLNAWSIVSVYTNSMVLVPTEYIRSLETAPCKVIRILESGKFLLVEYGVSGIHLKESRIPLPIWIRNPESRGPFLKSPDNFSGRIKAVLCLLCLPSRRKFQWYNDSTSYWLRSNIDQFVSWELRYGSTCFDFKICPWTRKVTGPFKKRTPGERWREYRIQDRLGLPNKGMKVRKKKNQGIEIVRKHL